MPSLFERETMNENIINVKDFILDGEPSAIELATKKAPRTRKKPTVEWEIVLQDAVDAVIRRKTAKTSKLLVLLMSKGQFYIKDEKTESVEVLNADNLSLFTRGMEPMKVVPWSTAFEPGKRGLDKFLEAMFDENFQWLARRGEHKLTYAMAYYEDSHYQLMLKREKLSDNTRKNIKTLCDEFEASQTTLDTQTASKIRWLKEDDGIRDFKELVRIFGIDRARTFVRKFLEARYVGNAIPNPRYLKQVQDICNCDFNRMVEYLFFDSIRQGHGIVLLREYYSDSMYNFLMTWIDTLRMQKRIYGKVRDKYPDNLIGAHQILSFKSSLYQVYINESLFHEHSERLAENIYKDDKYIIRPPYNKEDMIEEATMQANCLASYIDAYANDQTDIYFMRDINDPEKSLVTVEVRDGRIRQAYQALNQRPTAEQIQWLSSWAMMHGIEMVDVYHQRPLCA